MSKMTLLRSSFLVAWFSSAEKLKQTLVSVYKQRLVHFFLVCTSQICTYLHDDDIYLLMTSSYHSFISYFKKRKKRFHPTKVERNKYIQDFLNNFAFCNVFCAIAED